MTGVLSRLIGRATGRIEPRLRPRSPGRFETTPGEWARPLVNSSEDQPVTQEAPDRPMNESDADAPAVHGMTMSVPVPEDIGAPAKTAPNRPTDAEPPKRQRQMETTAEHAPAPARVNRFLEQVESQQEPPPRLLVPEPDEASSQRVRAAREIERFDAPEPPAPLLPLDQATEPNLSPLQFIAQEHPALASLGRTPGEPSAASELPDIVINIGQIDVRAESPRPQVKKQRRAERPAMTSLSDYLKNGRAGR